MLVAKNYKLKRLGGRVELRNTKTGSVRLGFSSVEIFDERTERGIWQVDGTVRFAGIAWLSQGSRISVGHEGTLSFGDSVCNTAMAQIVCHDRIDIGDGCLISWDTLLMDTDFHAIDGKSAKAPIEIGRDCWIGCRTAILKGAVIPDGSVIAAQSVITKNLQVERSLYGGTNRLLRRGISWNK